MQRRYEVQDTSPLLTAEGFLANPSELRTALEARGALTFTPYVSGLFPASDLPPKLGEATGMDMAWLRDNAHIANALYEDGQHVLAIPAGRAMLQVLHSNRGILDGMVNGKIDPNDPTQRLPVRVQGDTLANDREHRVQNDSVGYTLWFISRLMRDGALQPHPEDLKVLAQTVRYLEKVRYWQDEDDGHWEEDKRVHASSIGVAIAGLQEAQNLFLQVGYGYNVDFAHLIDYGHTALRAMLGQGLASQMPRNNNLPPEAPYPDTIHPNESFQEFFTHFNFQRREYDAALLFLAEPLNILEHPWEQKIITDIEQHLQRNIGIVRYIGDTYWEPRFPHIMGIYERTSAAEGRLEARNQTTAGIGYTGTEAQWTLFDPLLSTYWGRRYQQEGDPSHHEKQLFYLNRSLAQLALTSEGKLQLPEAYYYEYTETTRGGSNSWIPNHHIPLLWSQANLLSALRIFEAVHT